MAYSMSTILLKRKMESSFTNKVTNQNSDIVRHCKDYNSDNGVIVGIYGEISEELGID